MLRKLFDVRYISQHLLTTIWKQKSFQRWDYTHMDLQPKYSYGHEFQNFLPGHIRFLFLTEYIIDGVFQFCSNLLSFFYFSEFSNIFCDKWIPHLLHLASISHLMMITYTKINHWMQKIKILIPRYWMSDFVGNNNLIILYFPQVEGMGKTASL